MAGWTRGALHRRKTEAEFARESGGVLLIQRAFRSLTGSPFGQAAFGEWIPRLLEAPIRERIALSIVCIRTCHGHLRIAPPRLPRAQKLDEPARRFAAQGRQLGLTLARSKRRQVLARTLAEIWRRKHSTVEPEDNVVEVPLGTFCNDRSDPRVHCRRTARAHTRLLRDVRCRSCGAEAAENLSGKLAHVRVQMPGSEQGDACT